MDWRERLKAVGLIPAHGTGTWRDRCDRLIEIDWQAQRFTYRCAPAERPAAFTPGMSYPLDLLVTTDLCPPASVTAPVIPEAGPAAKPGRRPTATVEQRQLNLF